MCYYYYCTKSYRKHINNLYLKGMIGVLSKSMVSLLYVCVCVQPHPENAITILITNVLEKRMFITL